MTVRLSMSSLAGTARTLVAVGTARLACMLVTTRAAGPLRVVTPSDDALAAGLASAGLASAGEVGALTGGAAGFCATGSAVGAPSARGVAAAGPAPEVGGLAGVAAGAGLPVSADVAPLAGPAAGAGEPLVAGPESTGL